MGNTPIGIITMGSYSDKELDNPVNHAFVKAWHETYGPSNYPDSIQVAAWDMMQVIFDTVKKLDGNLGDIKRSWRHSGAGAGNRPAWQGRNRSANTRHRSRRARIRSGPLAQQRLGHKVLATIPQVKKQVKVLKVGRCGQDLPSLK